MKLKKYLTETSKKISATKMEEAIVDVWNNGTTTYKDLENIAISVCEYLKKQGVSGFATHLGKSSLKLSNDWIKFGGTNKTPKTDFKIGKYNISAKKSGDSQLVSGNKNETQAIFFSVAEKMNIFEEIKNIFDSYLERFVYNKKVDKIETTRSLQKSGDDIEIKIADEMHKEFYKILNEYFAKNKEFRREIIKETITGKNKFGQNTDGCATHVLVWDINGKHSLNSVNDNSFITYIDNKSSVQFAFKSTTRKRNPFRYISSNLRIRVNEDIMNENILKSIFNKLKGFWNTLKNSFFNLLKYFGFDVNIKYEIKF